MFSVVNWWVVERLQFPQFFFFCGGGGDSLSLQQARSKSGTHCQPSARVANPRNLCWADQDGVCVGRAQGYVLQVHPSKPLEGWREAQALAPMHCRIQVHPAGSPIS